MKVTDLQTVGSIAQSMIDYARNSVTVTMNSSQSWVHIENNHNDASLYMQGSEADDFIIQYEDLCDRYQETNFDDYDIYTTLSN
jgi:hypothetical protein